MKKKIILMLSICSCLLLLSGCGNFAENIHIYSRNLLKSDATDITIDLDYTLVDYTKEYTKDGCIVTIFYEIKE